MNRIILSPRSIESDSVAYTGSLDNNDLSIFSKCRNIQIEDGEVLPLTPPNIYCKDQLDLVQFTNSLEETSHGRNLGLAGFPPFFLRNPAKQLLCIRDGFYYHNGNHSGFSVCGQFNNGNWEFYRETLMSRPLARDIGYPGESHRSEVIFKSYEYVNKDKRGFETQDFPDAPTLIVDSPRLYRCEDPVFVLSPHHRIYPWDRITGPISSALYIKYLLTSDAFDRLTFAIDKYTLDRDLEVFQYIGIKKFVKLETNDLLFAPTILSIPQLRLNGSLPTARSRQLLRQCFIDQNIKVQSDERLFIARDPKSWRGLINHDDVCTVLTEFGFKILHPSSLFEIPLNELATMLWNAKVVGTQSGSGNINAVFCQNSFFSIVPRTAVAPEHYFLKTFTDLSSYSLIPSSYDLRTTMDQDNMNPQIFLDPNHLRMALGSICGS